MRNRQNRAVFKWVVVGMGVCLFFFLTGTTSAQVTTEPAQTSTDEATQKRIEELIAQLGDGGWHVRRSTVNALAKIGQPALQSLIEALANKDEKVRLDAVWVLEDMAVSFRDKIDVKQLMQPLIKALEDESNEVRREAADALYWAAAFSRNKSDVKQAVQPLIKLLQDPLQYAGERAAEALGKIGDPQAIQPLIYAMRNRKTSTSRAAAKALAEIGSPAVQPLISILRDIDPDLRRHAAEALGEIGDRQAVQPLIQALDDKKWVRQREDKYARKAAAEALCRIDVFSFTGWKCRQNWLTYTGMGVLALLVVYAGILIKRLKKSSRKTLAALLVSAGSVAMKHLKKTSCKPLKTWIIFTGLAAISGAIIGGIYVCVREEPLYKHCKIVFVSDRDGNKEIYVMNADGSNQKNLTNTPAYEGDPSWSPDGEKIAFVSGRDGNAEIYVMNADGSGPKRMTDTPAHERNTSWSPDGKKIAFVSRRDGNNDIYVMNADGTEQKRLTNEPNNSGNWGRSPNWSPDGKMIAFVSRRDENIDIYVVNADGGEQRNITNNPANDYSPSWSPDGKKIAFESWHRDGFGGSEIYVANADGSGDKNLTNSSAYEAEPYWSPDGEKIAFRQIHKWEWGIHVINADGGEYKRIFADYIKEFSWSPDSKRLTYSYAEKIPLGEGEKYRRDRKNSHIYIINPDGSGQRRLTNSPGNNTHHSWSPFLPSDEKE